MDDVGKGEDELAGAVACGNCCIGKTAGEVGDSCGEGERGAGGAGIRVVGGADTSPWSGSSHLKLMCVLS